MKCFFKQTICAMALLGVAFAASASCAKVSDYSVDSITLEGAKVVPAFEKAVAPAGYTVVSHTSTDLTLNADGLGGPLDAVLDLMAEQSLLEYRVEGCKLALYEKGSAPVNSVFAMREGQEIHSELSQWSTTENWRLVWALPHTWKVFADTEIQAVNAVKAVSAVVEILRDEGKAIRLVVYQGNRVMEVVSSDLSN